MAKDEIHPDAAQLADFGLGKLTPQAAQDVEAHVAECDSCCHTLSSLQDDTFAELVRSSQPDDPRDAATLPPRHDQAQSQSAGFELPSDLSGHSRYEFLELLGTGGMGTVYKAEHRLMQRTVAIKVINSQLTHNEAAIERFRREVKAAARLSQANIVAAYDAEQAGSLQLLVMEFVEGTNLAEVIRRPTRLSVREACDYTRQAALGLQHAFEFGMVHRDIKPHNLMLTPDGQVKILDFGLAQLAGDAAAGLTREGSMMGTPDYMAPEQARDAGKTDIRGDIYSLGCTLYALLTGQPPFPEGSEISKVMAHTEQEPKPVSEFRDDVPDELLGVLRRMTAKRPEDRYQSPDEVAQALLPFLAPAAAVTPPARRFPWKVATAMGGAALLLAGVVFVVTDNGRLRIESSDQTEVVVSKDGREYAVIDVTNGSKVSRLPSGKYEISLKGESALALSESEFTLRRGDEVVVVIEQVAPTQAASDVGANQLREQEQAAVDATPSWLTRPGTNSPTKTGAGSATIRSFNSADKTITQDGVTREEESWRIQSDEPRTVRLFEVDDIRVEETKLVYRARIRTENLDGKAFLEMWVRVPPFGESFSKGLNQTVSGTSGWSTYEIPFFLKEGEMADLVKLNLVVGGQGTVFIKDIQLLKTPLPN